MTQCAAISKRSGEQCRKHAIKGRRTCEFHGGKTPTGPANHAYKDGRYSKALPQRMLARYVESLDDPEKLSMESELALLDTRILDLVRRVDSGESSQLWRELHSAHRDLLRARRMPPGDAAVLLMNESLHTLGQLITRGTADYAAWSDVVSLIEHRRRLVESERKRMIESELMITTEAAMSMMNLLVDAMRRHVNDDHALRAVAAEFSRLVGRSDDLAAHSGETKLHA